MKIENFTTGIKVGPKLQPIKLDPKDNIKNKKHIRDLLKNIAESSLDSLKKNLEPAKSESKEKTSKKNKKK